MNKRVVPVAFLFIVILFLTGYKSWGLVNSVNNLNAIKGIPPRENFPIPDSLSFIYSRWTVSRYVLNDAATVSDEDNLKKLLGKTISLTEVRAVMFSDTCLRPIYDFKRFNTLEFFYKFYGHQNNLGINRDSISVVRVRCGGRTDYDERVITKFLHRLIILNNHSIAVPCPEGFLFFDKAKDVETTVKKLLAENKKNINKPMETTQLMRNIYIYQDDPNDPFHIISAAANGTKANTENDTKLK